RFLAKAQRPQRKTEEEKVKPEVQEPEGAFLLFLCGLCALARNLLSSADHFQLTPLQHAEHLFAGQEVAHPDAEYRAALRLLAGPQAVDRLEALADVLGRIEQEARLQPLAEQPPPKPLGVEQFAVAGGGRLQLRVVELQRVDLPLRPVEFPREGQQLEQEQ